MLPIYCTSTFYHKDALSEVTRVKDGEGNSYDFVRVLRLTDRTAVADTYAGSEYADTADKFEYGCRPGVRTFRDALITYWEQEAGTISNKSKDNANSFFSSGTGVGLKATWKGEGKNSKGQQRRLNTWYIGYPKNRPENIEVWVGEWSGTSSNKNKVISVDYKVFSADKAHGIYY